MTDAMAPQFVRGDYQALENRGITKQTCEFWRYQVGEYNGQPCHIANFYSATGEHTHQQLRLPGKEFKMVGGGNAPLYGEWLWGSKGKSITICTGLIDALSVSQVFGNKWPVVSVPNGDQSAERALLAASERLNGYEKIVLMFDQDESGRAAVAKVAPLLPVGKVHVAYLPRKDPNEVLLKDGAGVLTSAFWNAKAWRPDGIIDGSELTRERLKAAVATGYKLPYPRAQDMLYGLRKGELTMLTAASGIGKSTLAREWAYLLHQQYGLTIGNVFLEENVNKSGQAYVAMHNDIPLKNLRRNPGSLPDEAWDRTLAAVIHTRMKFYDHFGSLDSKNLLAKLRYMATVEKVDFIILDHISIVVSGQSSDEGERKDIDVLMTRLRSLIEETGVGVIAIVHVKRVQKRDLNAGDQISLTDLRGSGSLEQISDNVIAVERDQQGEHPTESRLRILKCRETGETGAADILNYNRDTGRLSLAVDMKDI